MSKTVQVRWNGAKQDPDQITQYGTIFPKGEWVSVPVLDKEDNSSAGVNNRLYLNKFKGNPWFEVKGSDNDTDPNTAGQAGVSTSPVTDAPVRASVAGYKVSPIKDAKNKTTGFIIVDKDGRPVPNGDEYVDESSAQVVADGMNKVAP